MYQHELELQVNLTKKEGTGNSDAEIKMVSEKKIFQIQIACRKSKSSHWRSKVLEIQKSVQRKALEIKFSKALIICMLYH